MSGVASPHRFPVRVYYEDTDFSGVVYHASYLRFLERGRTEFLRALGVNQSAMHGTPEHPPLAFAVRHMEIDFRSAARMDDLLIIETAVAELGGASVTMRQAVLRDGSVLVAASVRIALVANGKAQRLPPELRVRLAADPEISLKPHTTAAP